jgi:hypothetical protein
VYLPVIEAYVPRDVLRAFRAFLEFCYIAQRNVITAQTLTELQEALDRFHQYRKALDVVGIRLDETALPRLHSMVHYVGLIRAFGAPNGLSSSFTESVHIRAIRKSTLRGSGPNKSLGQILLANQRLDKLAAARTDFTGRGMLDGGMFFIHFLIFQRSCFTHVTSEMGSDSDPGSDTDGSRAQENDNCDNLDAIVEGPVVQAYVELAGTIRRFTYPNRQTIIRTILSQNTNVK